MPLERVSQGFKDISMTFQANPLNQDVIVLKNENAIARSIKNIVCTDFEPKDMLPSIFNSISNDNNYIKNITCTDFEPKDILYVIFKILTIDSEDR